MHRGWVKDWRKDEDWRWHPLNLRRGFTKYEAFKDLIKLANHEFRTVAFEGQSVVVARGQCITSQSKLAIRWKWSIAKVHRFLNNMKKNHEVDFIGKSKCTLITICNYDIYQSSEELNRNSDEKQMKSKRKVSENKQELKEFKKLKKKSIGGKKKNYGKPGITKVR